MFSVITQQSTRVDTDNIQLWRSMGLPLDESGNIESHYFTSEPRAEPYNHDVMALQAIIRLMCKLINYISTKTKRHASTSPSTVLSESGSSSTQTNLWSILDSKFDNWLRALPPSFQPDVTRKRKAAEGNPNSIIFADEVWFVDNACAMAFMYFRMAKILLLIYKPMELVATSTTPTPPDWLHTSREVQKELNLHTKELVSIALGLPDDFVKSNMVQPLYVAGRCLTMQSDQQELITMLEDIENNLGMATGYRIKALVEEWGTDSLQRTSELDCELTDLSSSEEAP
jgi:hypothetical protein